MNLNISKIRNDFPYLTKKTKDKPQIYFDNAATTHKPYSVIESIGTFYSEYNSNILRSSYSSGSIATKMYQEAHEKVAKFINASSYKEIIMVKNSTEAINLVFQTLNNPLNNELKFLEGDEIIVTEMEHHSNLIPWQQFNQKSGIKLNYLKMNEKGELNLDELKSKLNSKTKLVCCTQVSNAIGTINPVKEICSLAHEVGAMVLVDGTQSAPHMPVDVKDLDCDFFVFSAHKMLGPMGVGVLYGKKEILEKLPPFLFGGGMIKEVEKYSSTFEELPWKYEAGTPNVCGGIAFGGAHDHFENRKLLGAIDYLNELGMENIQIYEKQLTKYALEGFKRINGLTVYGPDSIENRGAIIAFNVMKDNEMVDSHILASMLNDSGISVRAGKHCAHLVSKRLNAPFGSVRVSFYIYNTEEEIDYFLKSLDEIINYKLL